MSKIHVHVFTVALKVHPHNHCNPFKMLNQIASLYNVKYHNLYLCRSSTFGCYIDCKTNEMYPVNPEMYIHFYTSGYKC